MGGESLTIEDNNRPRGRRVPVQWLALAVLICVIVTFASVGALVWTLTTHPKCK